MNLWYPKKKIHLKKHTRIYYDFFGYSPGDFVPSELSGLPCVDINHIDARGMGGDPQGKKDNIFNLMGMTREEHDKYGDKKQYKEALKEIHLAFMETRIPQGFDKLAKQEPTV